MVATLLLCLTFQLLSTEQINLVSFSNKETFFTEIQNTEKKCLFQWTAQKSQWSHSET